MKRKILTYFIYVIVAATLATMMMMAVISSRMFETQVVESMRYEAEALRALIEAHVRATGSALGKTVLADYETYLPKFKNIIPNDYQKMIVAIGRLEERGIPHEQAKLDAFYLTQQS